MDGENHSPTHFPRGRGSGSNPPNRFEKLSFTPDLGEEPERVETQFFKDTAKSVLSEIDIPDFPMSRSLNLYRGCAHGCAYCYARPTHEFLGMSSGLDFESKIFVKEDAPEILREELMRPGYRPEAVAISGVTDPYQHIEAKLRLTRRCLEVFAEFRNPVAMITKSALIERDADILGEMASEHLAFAAVSVTTLSQDLQRLLEPRASTPRARLKAIATLAKAGIPVGVSVAPIIPGLTDHEIPAILKAAAEAGATRAWWVMLRLPYALKELFTNWLEVNEPLRKEKVLSKLRQLHGGKLYDATFGHRMTGSGPIMEQVAQLFQIHSTRLGLNRERQKLDTSSFKRPSAQLELF